MRHQFSLIVKKAGLEPIPRPFDSMREIRSTEVYDEFGAFLEGSSNHPRSCEKRNNRRCCQKVWRIGWFDLTIPETVRGELE